jgi:hypothetical protein
MMPPAGTGSRAGEAIARCSSQARELTVPEKRMAAPDTDAGPRIYLEKALRHIARLRATGPNPFDYFQWADETTNVLTALYGPESDELKAFRLAVADRGRTVDQRGILDNMTLGLHGDWGIWARLDRAEQVMREILARHP